MYIKLCNAISSSLCFLSSALNHVLTNQSETTAISKGQIKHVTFDRNL